jgi:CheY-like chemotaxis protein
MTTPNIERAVLFERAVRDRFHAAEELIQSLPELFKGCLVSCDLAYRRSTRLLAVVARFDPKLDGPDVKARFDFWAHNAGAVGVTLSELDERERVQALARIHECDVSVKSVKPTDLAQGIQSIAQAIGLSGERRVAQRVRVQLAIEVGPERLAAEAYDLSEGGMFIPSQQMPPMGDRLPIRLKLPGAEQPFDVEARVAHVRAWQPGGRGKPGGYGVAFIEPSQELKTAIAAYLTTVQSAAAKKKIAYRRASKRVPIRAPVAVSSKPRDRVDFRLPERSDEAMAELENLSKGGALVKTSRPLPVGTEVTLQLSLPDEKPFLTQGTVVHTTANAMGVEFKLDDESRDVLWGVMTRLTARQKRALVVDDDALIRAMLSDALEARGFEVVTAQDGLTGLHLLLEELLTLDVLVTDLNMPEMTGEGLMDLVRNAGGEVELDIVAITGSPRQEQLERIGLLGARVLDKAMGPDRLAEAIDEVVRARRERLNKGRG